MCKDVFEEEAVFVDLGREERKQLPSRDYVIREKSLVVIQIPLVPLLVDLFHHC